MTPNGDLDVMGNIKVAACVVLLAFGITLIAIGIYWFASAMHDAGSLYSSTEGEFAQIMEQARQAFFNVETADHPSVLIACFWFGVSLKYFFSLIVASMGIKAITTLTSLSGKKGKNDDRLTVANK